MGVRSAILALAVALFVHCAGAAPADQAETSAAASAIPFKQDKQSTADLSGRVVAALGACLLAGIGAIYLLRRRWAPGASVERRRLRLLEVQRIGVKSSVVLVAWEQEELLLAHTDGQVQLLARKPATPAEGARESTERGRA